MTNNNRSISIENNVPLRNQPVQQMISLGRRNGWNFHVLGYAEYPEKPVRLEKWLITPAHLDNSPIPKQTMERIQTIYTSGLRPKGFVVVHEAPMALTAPSQVQPILGLPDPNVQKPVFKPTATTPDPSEATFFSDFMHGLAGVLMTLATVVFPLLCVGLLALDPIVVAVMDDGYWVEIDRWTV